MREGAGEWAKLECSEQGVEFNKKKKIERERKVQEAECKTFVYISLLVFVLASCWMCSILSHANHSGPLSFTTGFTPFSCSF